MQSPFGFWIFLAIFVGTLGYGFWERRQITIGTKAFRERPVRNAGSGMLAADDFVSGLLTERYKTPWRVVEYSLRNYSGPVVTFWMGLDGLVEAETAEGRWLAAPKSTINLVSLQAPSGICVATRSATISSEGVLLLSRRWFRWKRISPWWTYATVEVFGFSTRIGSRKWALHDPAGTPLVICEADRQVNVCTDVVEKPILPILLLTAGYLLALELDCKNSDGD